jgi:hypothetical protein
MTSEQFHISRDALVIRFRPIRADQVLASAVKEHRRTGHYRVSVFADIARPGESFEVVEARLLEAAGLAGIDPVRNDRYFTCFAGQLLDRGFTFWKDDEPGEPAEHYSVDLGERPTLEDVNRFCGVFGPARRRPG